MRGAYEHLIIVTLIMRCCFRLHDSLGGRLPLRGADCYLFLLHSLCAITCDSVAVNRLIATEKRSESSPCPLRLCSAHVPLHATVASFDGYLPPRDDEEESN